MKIVVLMIKVAVVHSVWKTCEYGSSRGLGILGRFGVQVKMLSGLK